MIIEVEHALNKIWEKLIESIIMFLDREKILHETFMALDLHTLRNHLCPRLVKLIHISFEYEGGAGEYCV